jgi:pimeloyl-ACP methyl ester carboxylesterase
MKNQWLKWILVGFCGVLEVGGVAIVFRLHGSDAIGTDKLKPITGYNDTGTRVWTVAGQSVGGFGVWEFLEQRPDFYAAAIVLCGPAAIDFAAATARLEAAPFQNTTKPALSKGSGDFVGILGLSGFAVLRALGFDGVGEAFEA